MGFGFDRQRVRDVDDRYTPLVDGPERCFLPHDPLLGQPLFVFDIRHRRVWCHLCRHDDRHAGPLRVRERKPFPVCDSIARRRVSASCAYRDPSLASIRFVLILNIIRLQSAPNTALDRSQSRTISKHRHFYGVRGRTEQRFDRRISDQVRHTYGLDARSRNGLVGASRHAILPFGCLSQRHEGVKGCSFSHSKKGTRLM